MAEVGGHLVFIWETQLSKWLRDCEDLALYLRIQVIDSLSVELGLLVVSRVQWVQLQDLSEISWLKLWNELLAAEAVIVTHILVEGSGVGKEVLVLLGSNVFLSYDFLLEFLVVTVLEESTEDEVNGRGLVALLEWNNLGSSPTGLVHVVGIHLFSGGQSFPSS